ncbi:hypothetical protein F0562_014539 [Nyssa sinensis]|uniref:Beta-glucosidase n=1 Tax=Nyssa sinensis TaxID=561372 RepID=A0A5J4ZN24_9ASTE|nr:hypothetical protein F0562_014539 [Nyssa sinensis]
MAFRSLLFLTVILLIHPAARSDDDIPSDAELAAFNRTSFPSDFLFGAASSAFQYEDKIADGSNASNADEFYKLHQEDVSRIKHIGLDAFRISISWSRLILYVDNRPVLRRQGFEYYNNLINGLLNTSDGQRRVEPFVTLFHWDTPQVLEAKYGGFRNEAIVNDYVEYVNFCFKLFGDRVKYWVTFNEPHNFVGMGYATGQFAPGRCTPEFQYQYAFAVGRFDSSSQNCPEGNSGTEPYIVAHNILRAHAAAVELYRKNYKDSQKGKIGIVLNVDWLIPYDENNASDIQAVDRAFAFLFGWFMQPLYNGSYPAVMREYIGDRLPKFNRTESKMLNGSYDFLGLNYYTAGYAMDVECSKGPKNYYTDPCINITKQRNGKNIGPKSCSGWLYVYPRGIRELLLFTKNKYNNPEIYITENGFSTCNHGDINDKRRTAYHYHHLKFIKSVLPDVDGVEDAIEKNKNVKGYLLWSLLDDFEWNSGYTVEFGIIHVNYTKDSLDRKYKHSAMWYKHFLNPLLKEIGHLNKKNEAMFVYYY